MRKKLESLLQLSPWTQFVYSIVALSPALGDLNLCVILPASLIATRDLIRHGKQYPISPASRYVAWTLVIYLGVFCVNAIWWNCNSTFFKLLFKFDEFIYIIPLVLWLPHKAKDINILGMSRAAMVGVGVSVIGAVLEHFVVGTERVELFSGNALLFAAMLSVNSLLCLAQLKEKSVGERWLSLGLFVAGAYVVANLIIARGPTLCILVFGLIALIMAARSFGWSWGRIMGSSLALVLSLTIGFSVLIKNSSSHSVQRFTLIHQFLSGNRDIHDFPSIALRVSMYKSGFTAFMERPIFGHGPQGRFEAVRPYFIREMERQLIQIPDKSQEQKLRSELKSFRLNHLHNVFLTHAVAAGVLGLIAVVLVLTSPLVLWRRIRHRKDSQGYLYVALVFSLLVILMGMTNLVFFNSTSTTFSLFNIVTFVTLAGEER